MAYIGCVDWGKCDQVIRGIASKHFVPHPAYSGNIAEGTDIGLIRLPKKVRLNSIVKTVCLAGSKLKAKDEKTLVTVGYGLDEEGQHPKALKEVKEGLYRGKFWDQISGAANEMHRFDEVLERS